MQWAAWPTDTWHLVHPLSSRGPCSTSASLGPALGLGLLAQRRSCCTRLEVINQLDVMAVPARNMIVYLNCAIN